MNGAPSWPNASGNEAASPDGAAGFGTHSASSGRHLTTSLLTVTRFRSRSQNGIAHAEGRVVARWLALRHVVDWSPGGQQVDLGDIVLRNDAWQ